MGLAQLTRRALEIRQRYAELETARFGRAWSDQEIALGFVGNLGDLAKLVLAKNGVRPIPDADEKLAHELADCLWSILVLADRYNIDLEQAFLQTMDRLERHIKKESNKPA
jgi:NTP pyrophosphatase (non-canonical NTP hydrolase)